MHPFTYTRTERTTEAITLLGGEEAKPLAGGTTLVDLMKLDVERPSRLVDIARVPLAEIGVSDAGAEIGATATNAAVAAHPAIRARFPVLSEAILAGASPQIRNMATVGGNLMQRTRCPYFRDGVSPCNKRDPGSGCAARDGVGDSLAVLGTSESCYATHASDMAVALVALDAVVHVAGAGGTRDIPAGAFHRPPGETPHIETALAPGELITGVFVPASAGAARSAYVKVRERASYAFALASCAAAVEMVDGAIASVRLALGGVGTVPWRAEGAERVLVGEAASEELFRAAAEVAFADAVPLADNAYKVELGKRVVRNVLARLCATDAG